MRRLELEKVVVFLKKQLAKCSGFQEPAAAAANAGVRLAFTLQYEHDHTAWTSG